MCRRPYFGKQVPAFSSLKYDLHKYMHVHVYTNTYIHIHIYMYIFVQNINIYTQMYNMCLCMGIYAHLFINHGMISCICTHSYIHIYKCDQLNII